MPYRDHHKLSPGIAAPRRRQVLVLWLTLSALMVAGLVSASVARYERAASYLIDDTYYLDCYAYLELGRKARSALRNGVELYFVVELKVYRQRDWWRDAVVVDRRIRYKLFYYDLTRHYRVVDMRTGRNTNFDTLAEALQHLGSLNQYPLVKAEQINHNRRHTASIWLRLDRTSLPGPLKARALVSRSWRLESEVFQWSLN